IVGTICSVLIGIIEPVDVLYIHGSAMAADYSTGWAIFFFFILVFFINQLNKKFIKKLYLTPPELITVYIMMIVACAIPSWGFVMNLIGLLGGIFYYATPTNRWEELIHPHLPKHLFPKDYNTIWYLYEGLPKGMKIPWSQWITPLFHWYSFIIIFYLLTIFLIIMLSKQWIEKERLIYPLTELPSEMVNQEKPIYKNKLFYIGLLIPFIFYSLNGISKLFPVFKAPLLSKWVPIFRYSTALVLSVRFEVIGLAFLMPKDVLLSVWLFAFLFILETGFFKMTGYSMGQILPYSDPACQEVAFQSFGALIVLSLSCIWIARRHLKEIFLISTGKIRTLDEDHILYKISFWGFIICFIFVVWWISRLGLKFIVSLYFVIITILIFLGLTRIISQAGLAYYRAPIIPSAVTFYTFGSQFIGNKGLVSLGLSFPWAADVRTLVMASTSNGLKLANTFKLNLKKLLLAIFLSIIFTLLSSTIMVLILAYKFGGINLSSWQFGHATSFMAEYIKGIMQDPITFGKKQFLFSLIGAFLMLLILFARSRIPGWFLSPIGLAIGIPHPVFHTWFSVFIAWLAKTLIMKYGGTKVYNQAKIFFLGMVCGSFIISGLWIVISWITEIPIGFTLG
ncbi:MAG: hypothetical protein NZ891_07185, partial [bacterium]|nr:hypothetical protein [bacterium]MDW8164507.1 DUF6785 family protein [Candidatus Omnitrophota bacterium]